MQKITTLKLGDSSEFERATSEKISDPDSEARVIYIKKEIEEENEGTMNSNDLK